MFLNAPDVIRDAGSFHGLHPVMCGNSIDAWWGGIWTPVAVPYPKTLSVPLRSRFEFGPRSEAGPNCLKEGRNARAHDW
jgi:hypothetical protein